MLMRLRDFAEIHRVSERTVQMHVKENWEELQDHIDRRGKQGTWLDDFAQEFLLGVIQLPSKDEILIPTAREAALMSQLSEANRLLAEAERRASMFAEAAGKTALLEATNETQATQIADLATEVGKTQQKLEEEQKAHVKDNTEKDAEIAELKQKLEEAAAREQAMKNRGLLARIFRKGE